MATANQSWRRCNLEADDLVMLRTENLLVLCANQDQSQWKLQYPSARAYTTVEFHGLNAVKSELLVDMVIQDTVYIRRLKKYTTAWFGDNPPSRSVQTVRNNVGTIQCHYVLERITLHMQMRGANGGYRYHIKWEGYDHDEITWVPVGSHSKPIQILDDCKKRHGLERTKAIWTRKR